METKIKIPYFIVVVCNESRAIRNSIYHNRPWLFLFIAKPLID